MRIPFLSLVASLALLFAAGEAEAGSLYVSDTVTASITLHAGPGPRYRRVVVVPAHAPVGVYHCAGWCEVTWGPYRGYASATFIAAGPARFTSPMTITPVGPRAFRPVDVPLQPAYLTSQVDGPCRYDRPTARIWYYDGRWLDRPDYFLFVQR